MLILASNSQGCWANVTVKLTWKPSNHKSVFLGYDWLNITRF